MTATDPVGQLALRLADNCLILGQRVSAWCGHAPALEEDIALANTALDLIGQATLWFDLAIARGVAAENADALAFGRDAREFRNCLLVEQPNDDYAVTLMRQFLFDSWHHAFLDAAQTSRDDGVAEIAAVALKEVRYHRERARDLVIRLGDGSPESHARMNRALSLLWRFTGELTAGDRLERDLAARGVIPDLDQVRAAYDADLADALFAAGLTPPADTAMRTGGRDGLHGEALGHLLAEMQWLQRAYPGARW